MECVFPGTVVGTVSGTELRIPLSALRVTPAGSSVLRVDGEDVTIALDDAVVANTTGVLA